MSPRPRPTLSLASLPRLAPPHRPRVDPRELAVGIVHLGPGAFHRAHQAVFTEDAVAEAGGTWGIAAFTQTSPRVVERLAPQDGLYSVAARDAASEQIRVVGTLRELHWARSDPERLLGRFAEPAVQVVTVTVTEKGYRRDPATGGPDLTDPDLAADLADGGTRTILGQITQGLRVRRRSSDAPLSVVSCDNLSGNGEILRALVLDVAERTEPGLTGWIEERVTFPATMVDRIVPAPTDRDREAAGAALGLADAGALVTEPFAQWVIEDRFAAGRPAWERAGAILAPDVAPYERVKLRMLNGTHSLLAYLGALAGCRLIADTLRPSLPFAAAAQALQDDDVAPTIAAPPEIDLTTYGEQVLHRFANPALPYRTLQVAGDGSQKLPERLLGVAADRRAAGAEPRAVALAVAAWMRVVSARRSDDGRDLAPHDPLGDEIAAALHGAGQPAEVVDRLLGIDAIFDPSLAADATWRDLLVEGVERLTADGAAGAARALIERSSRS